MMIELELFLTVVCVAVVAKAFALRKESRRWQQQKTPFIPPEKRNTLVLDLDDTMIHTFLRKPYWLTAFGLVQCRERNVVVSNKFVKIFIGFRPYLSEFLRHVSQSFELAVYTAGERGYAGPIIDLIEEETGVLLQERYFRQSCRTFHGVPMKDLRVTGRDLKNVAIVDDSEYGYYLHRENGIPIKSWSGDPFDKELVRLLPMLAEISLAPDVRKVGLSGQAGTVK